MSRRRERSCRGKRRYHDQKEALRSMRTWQRKSTRDVIPMRSYFCANRRGWHLTSQPKRNNDGRVG